MNYVRKPLLPTFGNGQRNILPNEISNNVLWLDAKDASTISLNGSTVSQWSDKSGGGNNVTQGTASNQPTYQATGLNGKPTLVFDGNLTSLYLSAFSKPFTSQPITVFCVVQFGATLVTSQNVFDSATRFIFGVDATYAGTSLSYTASTVNTPHQHSLIYNNTSSINRRDGIQVASGTVGANAPSDMRIGGRFDGVNHNYNLNGKLSELIFYDRLLPTSEIEQVESYLDRKWMTPVTFSPNQIADQILWLDAADSSTISLNGSTVSQWNDKSGNSFNVVQGTEGAQPSYNATGLNGKGSIEFDGVNDSLASEINIGITGNDARTIFIVGKLEQDDNSFIALGAKSTNELYSMGSWGEDWLLIGWGGAPTYDYNTGVEYDTNNHIHTITHDQTTTNWYIDGAEVGAGYTHTYATAANKLYIGVRVNDSYMLGNISEIIIYERALSSGERTEVFNYLSSKWGI